MEIFKNNSSSQKGEQIYAVPQKNFERFIVNRILQLESLGNIDLSGKQQHGFKNDRNLL